MRISAQIDFKFNTDIDNGKLPTLSIEANSIKELKQKILGFIDTVIFAYVENSKTNEQS